ncbi:MAG: T9SS type A sorting domain-containing protein [Prolixibacteraceae bacterium]
MKRFYQTIGKSTFMFIVLAMLSSLSFAGTSHYTTVWQGENGQNHMNFLVVSATLEDLQLKINDEIAVFSGTKCVGVTKLTKALNPADNTTFVNISASEDDGTGNGFTANDAIIFKFWDDLNQKEMTMKAVSYRNDVSNWSVDGKFTAGATAVVELVSYVELTQNYTLLKGYNLISSYVTPSNADAAIVTKPLRDLALLVKMLDEAGNSLEDWGAFGGWINNVGSIQKTEGYKIKVADNCTLHVTGRPVVLPLDIALKAGWNIVSFPRTDEVNAISVIQPLIDANVLVKVQDEAGNSIEDWGIFGGWKNGIGNFSSGKAYKIKVNANATLTILENYLKSAFVKQTSVNTEYFFSSAEGNGTDHMNINMVGLNEAGLSAGDELAAFDGQTCVGTIKLTADHLEQGNASLISSSLTDNLFPNGFLDGHSIKIYQWSKQSGNELPIEFELVSGQMVFEKNSSTLIKLKSSTTGIENKLSMTKIEVYPNPSVGHVTVRFSELPEQGSRIDILDITGRKVASRLISGFAEDFNLEAQSAGIYFVKTRYGSVENIQKLIVN